MNISETFHWTVLPSHGLEQIRGRSEDASQNIDDARMKGFARKPDMDIVSSG